MGRLFFCVIGRTVNKPAPSPPESNCISFPPRLFFCPSEVTSSLTLFCLWSVAHGLRARRRMYLLAYIGADESKRCCGMERVTIAAQRQTVAVSNCCRVMNPEPPCAERSVRLWTPFSLPDPGRERASVIHYVHLSRWVSSNPRWNIFTVYQSADKCSVFIVVIVYCCKYY